MTPNISLHNPDPGRVLTLDNSADSIDSLCYCSYKDAGRGHLKLNYLFLLSP